MYSASLISPLALQEFQPQTPHFTEIYRMPAHILKTKNINACSQLWNKQGYYDCPATCIWDKGLISETDSHVRAERKR